MDVLENIRIDKHYHLIEYLSISYFFGAFHLYDDLN